MNFTTDKNGWLMQVQEDESLEGGDSASFSAHRLYLDPKTTPYYVHRFHKFYHNGELGYCRYPEKREIYKWTAFYASPWEGVMSRDQLTPILCLMIKHRIMKENLKFLFHHALSLFLFTYNTIHNGSKPPFKYSKIPDPTGPSFWALELRLFGWVFWPIYFILDFYNLLVVMHWNKNTFGDDHITLGINIITTYETYPTPISKLTFRLWDKKKFIRMMWSYWSTWRKQPGLYYLYKNKILALEKKQNFSIKLTK